MSEEKIEKDFRSKFGADYIDLITWIKSDKDIKSKILIDSADYYNQ